MVTRKKTGVYAAPTYGPRPTANPANTSSGPGGTSLTAPIKPKASYSQSVPTSGLPSFGPTQMDLLPAEADYRVGLTPNTGFNAYQDSLAVGLDRANSNRAADQARLPSTVSGGGSGSGGGGGGGYAGPNVADFNVYQDAMRKFLMGDSFTAKPQAWASGIGNAVATDTAAANAAFDGINWNTTNPWAGQTVAAPQIDPGLAAFIQSQGGDLGAYGNQVGMAQAGGNAAAANWQNLNNAQSAGFDANLGAMQNISAEQRAQILRELSAQGTNLQLGADQQTSAEQKQLDARKQDQILALIQAGLQYGVGANVNGL